MIFMRALLTDGVRVCHVKAYHTELAATCLCVALIEIHNSEKHWTTTLDISNKMHDPIIIVMIYLTTVVTHKVLDECLGLDSILACLLLLNYYPRILAPLLTIILCFQGIITVFANCTKCTIQTSIL